MSGQCDAGGCDESVRPGPLHWWGWFLVVVLVAAILMPGITMRGMFLDGITYAAIGRNMAEGLGSWWCPHYTATLYPQFHEQPPLAFVLQAALFRAAGDHYLVEKVYSMLCMFGALVLLRAVWRELCVQMDATHLRPCAWLPVLLWMGSPKWAWAYRNNILENTMAVFCLLSALLSMRALSARRAVNVVAWAAVAGVALVGACLTKGPAGLFPLVVPVAVAYAAGRTATRRGWSVFGVCLAMLAVCGGLLWLRYPVRHSMGEYMRRHLVPALIGGIALDGARGTIARSLIQNVAPMGFPAAVCLVIAAWRRRDRPSRGILRAAGACLLVGLCGTLPLMVSRKLRSFYIVPALPFFALGFAAACLAHVRNGRTGVNRLTAIAGSTRLRAVAVALPVALVVVSLLLVGRPRRDGQTHAELVALAPHVSPRTIVGGDAACESDWYVHALLQRHLKVSLDSSTEGDSRDFYMGATGGTFPTSHEPTGLSFHGYTVLRKRSLALSSTAD